MTEIKEIDSYTLINFIELLHVLHEVGLPDWHYGPLEDSGLDMEKVDALLEQATEMYKSMMELKKNGYHFLPPNQTLSKEQLEKVCKEKEGYVKGVAFVSTNQLDVGEISEKNNVLFNNLLVGEANDIGEEHGLYYYSLFSNLPFVIEGDLTKDSQAEILEEEINE